MTRLEAQQRPSSSRVAGFAADRLRLARQLRALNKTQLAERVGVTPSAVTQYELGHVKPSIETSVRIALALGMPLDFFSSARPSAVLDTTAAHFRSLRATTKTERAQALAFGRLAFEVLTAIERYIELPGPDVPHLDSHVTLATDACRAARETRLAWALPPGPVGHVIRQLELHGILVLRLPVMTERVDAFSYFYGDGRVGGRPAVFLNPAKGDRARARFDAAHELGHLVMHHDVHQGSRVIENQAQAFAAEFLMPRNEVESDLPRRLDWDHFHVAKRKWGTSLKALVYRARSLGLLTEHSYKRGMAQLAQWGDPEPGDLGPAEAPRMLEAATQLLDQSGISLEQLADEAALPVPVMEEILAAGSDSRLVLAL